MSSSNPFEVLGVHELSTNNEIKIAYLKLAKSFHPDVNNNVGAKIRFQEISAAYELIKTDVDRAQYFSNIRKKDIFNDTKYKTSTYDSFYRKDKKQPNSRFEKLFHDLLKKFSNSKLIVIIPTIFVLSLTFSSLNFNKVNIGDKIKSTEENMVKAWLNPITQRWETPAPWDPVYRKSIENKPLQLVKKELVYDNITLRTKD